MEYQGVSSFPNIFFVASLCSFICLQAVYQLSGAVCKATWNGYPSYSLLTFISRFVIDFLSIRKVITFSAFCTLTILLARVTSYILGQVWSCC